MKTLLALALGAFLGLSSLAFGQSVSIVVLPGGCGTGNFSSGQSYLTVDSTGRLCQNGNSSGSAQAVSGQTNVTPVDCSGTIATGGTAQALFSAQTTLRGFIVMNLSTDKLGLAFNGAAAVDAAGTYSLNPATTGSTGTAGGSFSAPLGFGVNTAPSIVGATTGDKYTCTRW